MQQDSFSSKPSLIMIDHPAGTSPWISGHGEKTHQGVEAVNEAGYMGLGSIASPWELNYWKSEDIEVSALRNDDFKNLNIK